MEVKSWMVESLPFAGSVLTVLIGSVVMTVTKAAMSKGMSRYIFVLYATAMQALFLLPSFIFQRKTSRTPITFSLLCKFFLLSLTEITVAQIFVFSGIDCSTPVLASAVSQLSPAFTFLLAVIFRMEMLDLKRLTGQIKVIGALLLICGALVAVLYKGPPLIPTATRTLQSTTDDDQLWLIGGIFTAIATLSQSVSYILQAAILKEHSSEMTLVFFLCVFGTIQCGIVCLILVRDLNAWILTPDVELVSVITAGILGSLTFLIVAWCVKKRGPVFVAMFGPLAIVINALMGAIFLGDDILHVGSVVGAIVIVVGFYGVLWAQSKETYGPDQVTKTDGPQSSSQIKTPLLESHARV